MSSHMPIDKRSTPFTIALKKWWEQRIQDKKQGKDLPMLSLRGIAYLIRHQIGIDKMPASKGGFYDALNRIEEEYGVDREDLNIFSEPKISFLSRYHESPILEVDEDTLTSCCALLYIEKTTIIKMMESDNSLTGRGINIIKGMGFSTRDTNKMIALAQSKGIPILLLTDLDPSGDIMERQIKASGVKCYRLGITLALLKKLGISISDVNEKLPNEPKKRNHLKSLPQRRQDFYKDVIGKGKCHCRIEIDGVWAFAGKDKFVEAILDLADKHIPAKALERVLRPERFPESVEQMLLDIRRAIVLRYKDVRQKKIDEYKNSSMPFNDINLRDIESSIDNVIEQEDSGDIIRILKEALKSIKDAGG